MRAAAASSGLSPVGMRAATGKLAQAKSHALGGEVSDDSPPLEALQDHYHMSLEQGKLLATKRIRERPVQDFYVPPRELRV